MLFDYTSVTPSSIESVTSEAIESADALIAGIEADGGSGSFAHVLLPLDQANVAIGGAYGRGAFMARVHRDPETRGAGHAAEERLTKWRVDLTARQELYQAVRRYSETPDAKALQGEHRRLLEHVLRDFRRAGQDLPEEQRAEVKRLRDRLVELELAYQRNIDEYEDGLELTREELDGLPEAYLERLRPGEREGTFRVSLDSPEFFPFMEQAHRRDLRQHLEHKQFNRAAQANKPVLEEALRIRRELAALLGYPSWAHYAQEVRVARGPDNVQQLYDSILPALRDKGAHEIGEMGRLLAEIDAASQGTVRTWDWRYLDTRIRRRDYGIDPQEVAEHFPLEPVLNGMFALTAEVFGLRYVRVEEPNAWHPDVYAYEIRDAESDEQIATFYADLFPRPDKFGHAAAFPLVVGHRRADGTYERPISAIVANFTKPAADAPSLLEHDEVATLFHEFGHILHMSLTRAELSRFSGADTEWDFVEAPSQIMEHWIWEPEILQRFARHYLTGEPIPGEMVRQLVAARDLNVGVATLRQCYLGLMDLGFHGPEETRDVEEVYQRTFEVTGLPFHEGTAYYAGFGHLMGGYDAGYYGYLWAKVYGDDMYSRFEHEGITSAEVGRAYRREILEPNGSEDAEVLVERFLGRPVSQEAFLRHLGIEAAAV